MVSSETYIGIDLGTSAVKLLLVNADGRVLASASEEYSLSFPHPGWSEQNPADWWNACRRGIKKLMSATDPASVRGIGVAGQMHGLVVMDEGGNVIRPAILWNDGRSEEETVYLNETIGRESLASWTANIAFAGFTAPKILWMQKHEPENFEKIRHILLPKDYINYCLTGKYCTDYSDASGMLLLDVENRCWSERLLEICNLIDTQMPDLRESGEVIGTVRSELSKEFGFDTDVRVVAGAGDNAAAAIGTGTLADGACNISLGTSGTIFIASDHFRMDQNNALHAFAHANGNYHLMGCILSAASCNQWFCKEILGADDYSAEQTQIDRKQLGLGKVFFLPYLMGERSPINDASARAVFFGMDMSTTRADMVQAVLEGVAFALRDCLEVARSLGMNIRQSMLCGGGAKSTLWREILANVLQIDLNIPKQEEGPGLGAAMLVMTACGAYPNLEDCAAHLVHTGETVQVITEMAEAYEERYQQYCRFYPQMKELFRR